MKIQNSKPIQPTSGLKTADAARTRVDDSGTASRTNGGASDRVAIGAASELFDLVAFVSGLPEPADEAVAIEAAVRDGSYQPNLRSLAERLAGHAELRDALVSG